MFFSLSKQLGRISLRLTFWPALLFLVSALGVMTVSYFVIKEQLNLHEREVIEFRLRQYAGEYEQGGMRAVRMLASQRKGREQKAFFVRLADDNNDTLFLRDEEDWAEFLPDRLSAESPPRSNAISWITLDSLHGTTLLIGAAWLPDGYLLEVGRPTESTQSLLAAFRMATLVVVLIFLPLSLAGGVFLASRMLRPLHHLTAAVGRIVATGKFDARVPAKDRGGELDALVRLFNEMLSRIERLICGMRDSLDNVAHDLRTPITRIRQKAQAALAPGQSLEAAREALAECVEETEHVTTLLNTLMDIAEAESGLARFARKTVRLGEVIAVARDAYQEVAEEKGIAITSRVPADCQVNGDEMALRRVFVNLLDNAIKFTPVGGRVDITAERQAETVEIRVSDTGVGIAPEDVPRIWDRLFRGDKSRSERGLGLGLSFVHAIVKSHGGSATVESSPGAGTTMTVKLPAADA